MRIETIETDRLFIRSFRRTDAGFAISIWNDKEMGEYLPDEAMENIEESYVRQVESLGDSSDCCYLISESKETMARIGTCSFIPSEDGSVYDIAYCVHKKYWHRGYATEMAKGMIEYARQHGAKKITVVVNQENAASNAIVKKLGFVKVGEKTYNKRGTNQMFTDNRYEREL